MLSPAWLGVFVIMYGLVIVSVVLAIYLYCRRQMESIIKDPSSVVDLAAKKQDLEEELRKLDGERQKQESLREELASLSIQVAQEKQKRHEYRKEAEDLQTVISALSQDLERLESGKAEQEIKNDVAKEELENAEKDKPIVKLRVVRKHRLRT